MRMTAGAMLALVAAVSLWGTPASAYPGGATVIPPVPVTNTINVNVVDVCDTGGHCASTAPLTQFEKFAKAIFDQAGLGLAFTMGKNLTNVAGSSGCDGGKLNTFCADITTPDSSLFDSLHTLIDTPGHNQSIYQTTLNVYLVNHIVDMDNGTAVPTALYGWGLIGGNGVVVSTATNPYSHEVASYDTLAHELGHNLGLYHVDQPPYGPDPSAPNPHPEADTPFNLMNSGSRLVPIQLCQVTPYTCSGPKAPPPPPPGFTGTDELLPFQTAILGDSPMRNELPNVVGDLLRTCIPGTPCILSDLDETYQVATAGQTALGGTSIRYSTPLGSPHGYIDFEQCADSGIDCGTATEVAGTPVGTNEVYTYDLPTAVNPGESLFAIFCAVPFEPDGACSAPIANTIPFSVQFDFADGVTSRAGFDGTGFRSTEGYQFGFDPNLPGIDPNAPGLQIGPSLLPTSGVPWDTDGFGIRARAVATPEPGTVPLLIVALAGVWITRRR